MITKVTLAGLTCIACTKLTAKRIKQIPGVINATVTLETGMAEITADRAITAKEVAKVLEGTTYTVA